MTPVRWPGITETKIVVPRVRAEALERGRLLDLIDPSASVAVVVAPAGSGKSTVCAQLAAERASRGEAVAWLTLDSQDRDPTRLWAHLLTAVSRLGVPFDAGTEPAQRPIAPLINALTDHGERVTIVIDEYHTVPGPDIHLDISEIVESLPPNVQVVIASRVDPALPIPRLRVRGQLTELRIADLNFTEEEATRFFETAFRLSIDPSQIAQLRARTEGWAAALYVAGLGLRRADDVEEFVRTFSGHQTHLVDYIDAEIINQQDRQDLDFLLCTSILDQLHGDLCDSVIGAEGSALRLQELARTNLLVIELDNERRRYRYHHLLGDVLRSQLHRADRIDVRGLHARAGAWFADHDEPTSAVSHLVEAGEHEAARDLINQSWFPFINTGHSTTVWTWLDLIPDEIRNVDPILCRLAAWASLNLGAFDDIEPLLDVVDADKVGPPNNRVEANVIRSHRARHLGDTHSALTYATAAATDLDQSDQRLEAATHTALGIAQFWAGEHHEAPETLVRATRLAVASREEASIVASLGHHALLLATQGDNEQATQLARSSLDLCQTPQQETFHLPAAANLALARIALDTRDIAQADAYLADAARLAESGREPLAAVLTLLWQGEVSAITGDRDIARSNLRAVDTKLAALASPGWTTDELARSRNDTRFTPRQQFQPDHPIPPLTDRELVILRMLTGTGTRQEIADQLHISLATVKTHNHAIARKLGVSKRRDIIAKARQIDLIA